MSSTIQEKGTVAVQLDIGYKLVRIFLIIGDCIMVVLIACSFSAQYNGVYISLLNSAGSGRTYCHGKILSIGFLERLMQLMTPCTSAVYQHVLRIHV